MIGGTAANPRARRQSKSSSDLDTDGLLREFQSRGHGRVNGAFAGTGASVVAECAL
jgi:hypothetical protein